MESERKVKKKLRTGNPVRKLKWISSRIISNRTRHWNKRVVLMEEWGQ